MNFTLRRSARGRVTELDSRRGLATVTPLPQQPTVTRLNPTDRARGEIVAITGIATPGACWRCTGTNDVAELPVPGGRTALLCSDCRPRGYLGDGPHGGAA